jgi:hypothetical protein
MVTFGKIVENATRLEKKWPGRRTFSAKTVADVLEIKYADFIAMVRCGAFPAWKESGSWSIPMWEKGCPLEWAQNRRYDTSRRYRGGKAPIEQLMLELS